jgi:hypothetical protein
MPVPLLATAVAELVGLRDETVDPADDVVALDVELEEDGLRELVFVTK